MFLFASTQQCMPLRSTGITPLHHYYEHVRLPMCLQRFSPLRLVPALPLSIPILLNVASGWVSYHCDPGSLSAHTRKVPLRQWSTRLSQVPMLSLRCHAAASNPGGCVHTRITHGHMLPSRPHTLSASTSLILSGLHAFTFVAA